MATFIFIPDTLDLTQVGFLEGFSKQFDNLAFYVTSDKLTSSSSQMIGYCSGKTPYNSATLIRGAEWVHVNNESGEIVVQNANNSSANVTCFLYNLKEFKSCDCSSIKLQNCGVYIETLCKAVGQKTSKREMKFINSLTALLHVLDWILILFFPLKLYRYSSTATHFQHTVEMLKWSLNSVRKEGLTLLVRNIIVSKIFDIILGIFSLFIILQYERQVHMYVNKGAETIIHNLRDLLDILMGSPIGLKLNHAFNLTLGIFFFYHISLWRVFVQFTRPLLYSALYFLLFPAMLGLSFQVAIFEDLIKFCSIHVYCIYVYAARLYGLQIHTLISLWRLFIGRKYNPLRQRVDSYQYSHHQLFIGTLGFTILLFLLPTVLLYYIVFTAFRLGLKLLNFILTCLRVSLQYLPVYVVVLWLLNCPSIAGTVILKAMPGKKNQPVAICITLKSLTLWESIKNTSPDTIPPLSEISCSDVFHGVVAGILV